jgi:multiple sugar transport system permease protein
MKLRTVLLTAVGWLVALAFLAPYAHMLLTALKPTPELMKSPPSYLPSHGSGRTSPTSGRSPTRASRTR